MLFFSDQNAQAFWESNGQKKHFYAPFANVLMRKLRMLDAAKELYDLRIPPREINLRRYTENEKDNFRSESIRNTAFASLGQMMELKTLKWSVIIKRSEP